MPEGSTLGHRPNRGRICRNSVKLRLTTTARAASYSPSRCSALTLARLFSPPPERGRVGWGSAAAKLAQALPPRTPTWRPAAASSPFQGEVEEDYIGRAGRPEEAPKPSIRASVPSSDDSRALTSSNRV